MKRKLILKCGLSVGDIVMLTAAVRDLQLHCDDLAGYAAELQISAQRLSASAVGSHYQFTARCGAVLMWVV